MRSPGLASVVLRLPLPYLELTVFWATHFPPSLVTVTGEFQTHMLVYSSISKVCSVEPGGSSGGTLGVIEGWVIADGKVGGQFCLSSHCRRLKTTESFSTELSVIL